MPKLFDIYSVDILPEAEIRTSRSRGKGGQHVNKTESRVELVWDICRSHALPDGIKEYLLRKTGNTTISVVCETHRSQLKNREEATRKLYRLLDQLLTEKKKRKPTRVPKPVKEKRKSDKKKRSDIKKMRREKF
ncbi:MAG: alternative ribosome rescue aminoacyl-tRNA hydrolase ArfB [Bacteroidota bacterium]